MNRRRPLGLFLSSFNYYYHDRFSELQKALIKRYGFRGLYLNHHHLNQTCCSSTVRCMTFQVKHSYKKKHTQAKGLILCEFVFQLNTLTVQYDRLISDSHPTPWNPRLTTFKRWTTNWWFILHLTVLHQLLPLEQRHLYRENGDSTRPNWRCTAVLF